MSVVPENSLDLLAWDTKAFGHVATIGPKGEPQNNPVWFDWDGQYLTFSQVTTTQKYKNLRKSPLIAISILDPTNPYRYLEIRGRVTRFDPDPERALIDRLSWKYLGQDFPWHGPDDVRVIVVVEPLHTSSAS